jgi:ATP-dependent helicase HrpA
VLDDDGRPVGEGEDLRELTSLLRPRTQARLSRAGSDLERGGLTDWEMGTLPREFHTEHDGHPVVGYPALVDEGSTVSVRVLPSAEEQQHSMRLGTRRLLLLAVVSPLPALTKRLDNRAKLALAAYPHGGLGALLDDCVAAAVDTLVARHGGPAWDEQSFTVLRDRVRADLHEVLEAVLVQVQQIVSLGVGLQARVSGLTSSALAAVADDVGAQVDHLLRPGFVIATGTERLPHVLRYLRAAETRLEKAPYDLARDHESMRVIHELEDELRERLGAAGRVEDRDKLAEIGWMIEELRVSLFAQRLGTAYPVSEKRVRRALQAGS